MLFALRLLPGTRPIAAFLCKIPLLATRCALGYFARQLAARYKKDTKVGEPHVVER